MDEFLEAYSYSDLKKALNTLKFHTQYFCPVQDLWAVKAAIEALEVLTDLKKKKQKE